MAMTAIGSACPMASAPLCLLLISSTSGRHNSSACTRSAARHRLWLDLDARHPRRHHLPHAIVMKHSALLALVLGIALGALLRWALSPINPAPQNPDYMATPVIWTSD